MCTVSVVGWPGGLRLVANRDEQRARLPGLRPTAIIRDGVRAIMPIDPASGGTWISVNEHGLTITLLNVNQPNVGGSGVRSRGEIVARLAALPSVDQAVEAIGGFDIRAYSPFRVVCAAGGDIVEIAPHLGIERRYRLDSPVMFTSSGLGDDRVEGPRRRLFERMVARTGRQHANGSIDRQDAFHTHRWANAPHLSVFMDRGEASTVSRTVVEIDALEVWMAYAARPDWKTDRCRLGRRA